MAHMQFVVSDNNPNDTHGGGGCICDPVKQVDCKPPYIVVTDNFLEDPRSPHVVICQACVDGFAQACRGEALSVGERSPVTDKHHADYTLPAADVTEDDADIPEV